MATIKPFKALRPKPDVAADASCVPYDVVYTSEVREFLTNNVKSFLRVTRAEAEFEDENAVSQEEIFARAKENLENFISEEIFVEDVEPALYLYQLSVAGHSQTGIVGCCSVDEYENNVILKHEKTRPDKVDDRTKHMVTLRAQTGLIFLAFRNTDKIRTLIHSKVTEEPIYQFECLDGVKQTVWKIADYEEWVDAFGEVPNLYIADGHHRAESSSRARAAIRISDSNYDSETENAADFVIAGIYPAEDLKIMAYNRVVKDLNGLSIPEFLEKLKDSFSVEDATRKEPEHHGEFCMYLDAKWYQVQIREDLIDLDDPIKRLDVSLLQENLLTPILGIGDPRTDNRIGFVGGARGTDELERIVDSGLAEVAFSLFPTTMDDLFAVSDIGEIMPPKSTWFEPKLKDGLLVYQI